MLKLYVYLDPRLVLLLTDDMFDDAPRSPADDKQSASLLSVLPGFPSRGGTPLPRPIGSGATISASASNPVSTGGSGQDVVEELRQARREIELLKSMDPFHAAEMAIELQMEKMRCAEATNVRDSAVQRLASAYDSIKEKAATIGRLQAEKADLEYRLGSVEARYKEAADHARAEERQLMEGELARLRDVIRTLKDSVEADKENRISTMTSPLLAASASDVTSPTDDASSITAIDSNGYGENVVPLRVLQSLTNGIDHLAICQSSHAATSVHSTSPSPVSPPHLKLIVDQEFQNSQTKLGDPVEMVRTRNSVLAALPTPIGIPEDELKPIMLPSSLTIHEFLGNITGNLWNSLTGYRTFHDNTTRWCPDREEHGYFLTPLYKCTTKARVSTAHSWNEVDPRGRMTRPTECFYNRQGKWYYAGQYVALRLDDFSTKEWNELDAETSAMLVKETLAGRKNISPTVHYEVSQLYSCGALKISCVGLQCVGFNSSLYQTVVEQATKCRQNVRWRTGWSVSDFPATDGSDSNGNKSSGNDNCNAYSSSLFNFM